MNALVLGGSKGVGLSIARQLAEQCQKVCISSRSIENLERASLELSVLNTNVLSFAGDISDKDFAKSISNFLAFNSFGSVDILICNAGGPPQRTLMETSNLDWDKVIEMNLLGQIRLVKEYIPRMAKNKFGRIIFVGSTVAKEPSPSMVLSSTVRAGLSAFAKAISVQFASDNITVNTILMGGIHTDRLDSLIRDSAQDKGISFEEMREIYVSNVPIGRFAQPIEVSRVVNFLASHESSYITGQSIAIDGGLTRGVF